MNKVIEMVCYTNIDVHGDILEYLNIGNKYTFTKRSNEYGHFIEIESKEYIFYESSYTNRDYDINNFFITLDKWRLKKTKELLYDKE